MLLRTIVNEALTHEHDSLYYYKMIESIAKQIDTALGSAPLSSDERGLVTAIAAAYYAAVIPCINDTNPEAVAKIMINLASVMYAIGTLGATSMIGLTDSSSFSNIIV